MTYTAALLTLALIGASATVAKAECRDCAPPGRHYDSIEVIRTVREVDHSRVIEVPNTSYVSVVSYPVNRYHRIRHSRWLRVRG